MAEIWQKMKKRLIQLAMNPFLHSTTGTRNPSTRSATSTQARHSQRGHAPAPPQYFKIYFRIGTFLFFFRKIAKNGI